MLATALIDNSCFTLDVEAMKKVLLKAKMDVRRDSLWRKALIKRSLKVYVSEYPIHASFAIYNISSEADLQNSLQRLLQRQLTSVDNIKKGNVSVDFVS